MKRFGHLFEKIADLENLERAYRNARRGKSWQRVVQEFDANHQQGLQEIQSILLKGEYQTSEYRTKLITEPKPRVIYVLPFAPDRIVQHALIQVLEPIWESVLLPQSFACRKNLGVHRASEYTQRCVRKYKYCLQMDIRKFYPSINHEILIAILSRKIKCQQTLNLLREIVFSTDGCPIGNYTSQWFGNLYLDRLDQHLKHRYQVKGYCRYVDDFLVFGDSKEWLQYVRKNIVEFLQRELSLGISRWCLRPTKTGVDFVGYRHFPKKKLLRKSTSRQMKKTLYALQKHWPQCSSIRFRSTLASYDGWAKWAQTYHLRQKLKINKLQEMIGMRGIPKHLNTKFDYEFIRSQNLTGWQKHWQDLLDGYMSWISTGVLADGEPGIEDETHKVDTQEEKELDSDFVTMTRHQLEYKIDPNSKLLRIGFTLEEVEAGLT